MEPEEKERLIKIESYRVKSGMFSSEPGSTFGLFFIPTRPGQPPLKVLCSPLGESEWDHVSVSLPNRCPTWEEMCKVKDLFLGDKTCIQIHPPKSEYVNNHSYCLHLWSLNGREMPLPPSGLVGIKELGTIV